MLKHQSAQKDFFDSYVYERLLPNKHILLDIEAAIIPHPRGYGDIVGRKGMGVKWG